ncbi:TM221 protein, partial [Leucopsar rothschildi]|nr:TM221 protein [Leucopsar rothschildi]
LAALALFMLLLFELEAGIASACILTSGILVLLLSVLHALLRASQISQNSRSEPSQALYENDSAQPGGASDKSAAPPGPEIRREFSFPTFLERQSQPGPAARSRQPPPEFQRECRDLWRTHRTLGEDPGQGNPWNVTAREMRNGTARKGPGRDSTLV